MTTAVALIQVLGPLLPLLTGDISKLIAWIESVRAAAQQTGEWTADAESAYQQSILLRASAPEQQPDPH